MAIAQDLQLLVNLKMLYGSNDGINKSVAALNNLQSKTQELQNAMKHNEGFAASSARLEQLTADLNTSKAAYAQNSTALTTAKAKHKEISAQYAAENSKLNSMRGTYSKNSKEYKDQAAKVKELARQHKAADAEVKKLSLQEKELSTSITRTEKDIEKETQALNDFKNKLSSAGIDAEKFARNQEKVTQALERSANAQKNFSEIKQNLSFDSIKNKVMLPAVEAYATIKPMVQLSADFESAMARVKAVAFAGGTEEDLANFEMLKAQAAQLGADTQFTSIQAAGAMEGLARAGMSADSIKKTMPALLNMAAAEGMSIEQAANILAGVQGGMGLDASQSTKIADILAYTSGASNLSIAGLGTALAKVAPTAKGQNVTLEQISAYIGALANKGFGMEVAGTGLKNIFLELANAEKSKKLNELGVAVQTKSGEMVQIPEIMAQLNKSLGGKGPKEQLEKLSNIFGANAGLVQALMQSTASGEIQKLEKDITEKNSGRASTMANINLDTLNGQITLLSSAWDGFRTQIGDAFNPVIRAGVEALSNALSGLNNLMKEFPGTTRAIALGFGAIISAKTITGIFSITKSFLSLPAAFLEVINAGRNVSSVMSQIGTAAANSGGILARISGAASGAFSSLWGVVAAHPFIAIGTAAAGAAVFIWQNWDAIKEKFSAMSDYLREKWSALSNWWASWKFPDIFSPIKSMFDNITKIFAGFNPFENLYTTAVNVIESLKSPFMAFADWIGNIFSKLNPFNWELPSWLGGGQTQEQRAQAKQAAEAKMAQWDPLSGNLPGFATGGILRRPSIIQAAEDGPEAIIPLTDKSRGVPLLYAAARELGENNFLNGTGNNITNARSISGGNFNRNNNSSVFSPVINISVDGESGDLAQRIAATVQNVLEEISSTQERIAYA